MKDDTGDRPYAFGSHPSAPSDIDRGGGGARFSGNIGAAERLDFTVIGPAIDLVSRIEAVRKALDLPVVVGQAFARLCGGDLRSVGRHEPRGLGGLRELFAPDTPAGAVLQS
jgi:adenylate cyclase